MVIGMAAGGCSARHLMSCGRWSAASGGKGNGALGPDMHSMLDSVGDLADDLFKEDVGISQK
jgi:hypothetical protein